MATIVDSIGATGLRCVTSSLGARGPRLRSCRSSLVLSVVVLASATAKPAEAQSVRPVALDATIGAGAWLSNEDYRGGHAIISADAVLAVRLAPAGDRAIMAGAALGVIGTGPVTAVCITRPDGSCQPAFPRIDWIGLLGGIESRRGTWRVLAGPVYARADFNEYGVGFGGRAELAVPIIGPFGVVMSTRIAWLPRIEGNAIGFGSAGVGLRIR